MADDAQGQVGCGGWNAIAFQPGALHEAACACEVKFVCDNGGFRAAQRKFLFGIRDVLDGVVGLVLNQNTAVRHAFSQQIGLETYDRLLQELGLLEK